MKLLFTLLLTAAGLIVTAARDDEVDSTLFVHLVPHSYNPTFLEQLDDFFPWQQNELMQMHLSQIFTQVVIAL